jgi:hypothetical protein
MILPLNCVIVRRTVQFSNLGCVKTKISQGVPRLGTLILLGQSVVRIPAQIFGLIVAGAPGAAIGILCASAITVSINLTIVLRRLAMGVGDVLAVFLRPVAAAGTIYLAVVWLKTQLDAHHGFLAAFSTLLVLVGCGALIHAGVVLLFWWVSGRPDGAETMLLQQLRARFKRTA